MDTDFIIVLLQKYKYNNFSLEKTLALLLYQFDIKSNFLQDSRNEAVLKELCDILVDYKFNKIIKVCFEIYLNDLIQFIENNKHRIY